MYRNGPEPALGRHPSHIVGTGFCTVEPLTQVVSYWFVRRQSSNMSEWRLSKFKFRA